LRAVPFLQGGEKRPLVGKEGGNAELRPTVVSARRKRLPERGHGGKRPPEGFKKETKAKGEGFTKIKRSSSWPRNGLCKQKKKR